MMRKPKTVLSYINKNIFILKKITMPNSPAVSLRRSLICFVAALCLQGPYLMAHADAMDMDDLRATPNLQQKKVQAENIWDDLRQNFAIADIDHALVDEKIQAYTRNPSYLYNVTQRATPYFYYIAEELKKRGMPSELALLPIVESAFNPVARSSAKAEGIWQFIPSTGKQYQLTQNHFVDQRRHISASTQAALDYLQKLYLMFNDWHLALAAYNWGEGSVMRAIQKNQAQGLPTDFMSLKMPKETRDYVPKLLAIKRLVQNTQVYGVQLADIPNRPYFIELDLRQDMNMHKVAELADMSFDTFKALNPGFKKDLIVAANANKILLPWDKAETFQNNLLASQQNDESLASVTAITLTEAKNTLNQNNKIFEKDLPAPKIRIAAPNHISASKIVVASSPAVSALPTGDNNNNNSSSHITASTTPTSNANINSTAAIGNVAHVIPNTQPSPQMPVEHKVTVAVSDSKVNITSLLSPAGEQKLKTAQIVRQNRYLSKPSPLSPMSPLLSSSLLPKNPLVAVPIKSIAPAPMTSYTPKTYANLLKNALQVNKPALSYKNLPWFGGQEKSK